MLSETRPAKVGKWTEAALRILRERYLMRQGGEVVETPEEMCWRVALTIASGEARYGRSEAAVREVAAAFYDIMIEGDFLPNSPTLMNAWKDNGLQYSACYVLPIGYSMEEIFDSVKAAAIIHKSGGGTGFAFSRLRPKDDIVASTGGRASGPVSFLRVFNGATEAVKQGGTRRGANMGILRVDHPDILEFIDCKLDGGITNFNISVAVTDQFMEALASGGEYNLINPHNGAVGSIDFFIDFKVGKHTMIECKSMSRDMFDDLKSPLAEHRIRVIDFRTELPTLEDVFLKLTGHKIRD